MMATTDALGGRRRRALPLLFAALLWALSASAQAASADEARLLTAQVPEDVAALLATTCAGNVRAALLDAQSWERTTKPVRAAVQSELLALL